MHCTEYVVNMQKKHFRYNHRPLSGMHSEITKHMLPFLDSAAFIIRKTAQIHQMSFKADSRNVWHAEKFFTAGVIRVCVFWQSTGPIIGIREPTPFFDAADNNYTHILGRKCEYIAFSSVNPSVSRHSVTHNSPSLTMEI